jgi:hypothetical protein
MKFEIIKPEYNIIRIIPVRSTKNFQTRKLSDAIALSYKELGQRFHREGKDIFYESEYKICFIVDISHSETCFYFIFPKQLKTLMMVKLNNIWSSCTFENVDSIQGFYLNSYMYELTYKRESALSLNTDLRNNEPLSSIVAVQNQIQDDDRVSVIYNFCPRSQFSWKKQYESTMDKIRNHECVDKPVNTPEYRFKKLGLMLNSAAQTFRSSLGEFLGEEDVKKQKQSMFQAICGILESDKELSSSTKRKERALIIDTQLAVISYSKDKCRQESNAISVCQSYSVLGEKTGNELVYNKIKMKNINILDTSIGTEYNAMSSEEVASTCLLIPGRSILEKYKMKQIKIQETKVPDILKNGYISLGIAKYKGESTEVFIQDHQEVGSLPIISIGRMGSGKTTYKCNYAKYCLSRNESVVDIDFIKNCEASKTIEKVIPKDKLIVLDFSTEEGLQSLSYNEIRFTSKMTTFEKQSLANKKAELTIQLIDSINDNGEPLTPKMGRYLSAAANIVYLNDGTTLKDVVKCLKNHVYREEVIKKIPLSLKDELEEEIYSLQELDEWSKATKGNPSEKIGTKESKIENILDRITLLNRDFYLKKMYKKSDKNNIDFVKATSGGKIILVRMPQSKFRKYVKNVITTFLVTKLWLAAELRGETEEYPKRCHILIDEISQTKTAERYMESVLTQTRKFGVKFFLTCQYIDQFDKKTILSLKGSGATFMLLKGAVEEDFNYFKSEIGDIFEYEDLKNIPEHYSMNIIQTSDKPFTCITKLPKPIK